MRSAAFPVRAPRSILAWSVFEILLETEEEFNGWLPTLDTNIRVEEDTNIITYKFYEKPMAANTVVHARSAMPEDSKMRCLANDLTRRMLTTSERISNDTRRDIVDDYAQKLLNSGYTIAVTRRIIVAGLKGYEKKLKNSKKPGGKLIRSAKESYGQRARKKLLEKTDWFKDKKRPRVDSDDEDDLPEGWKENKKRKTSDEVPGMGKPRYGSKLPLTVPSTFKGGDDPSNMNGDPTRTYQKAGNLHNIKKARTIKTRSILFLRGTKGGKLAKRMRLVMERVKEIVGFNAKVVEKAGQKLRNTLSNNNPWKGQECGRSECITCSQDEEQKLDCRKRSVIYENICSICNPKEGKKKKETWEDLADTRDEPSIYVGESARSLSERAMNHHKDLATKLDESHMLKHWQNSHGGIGEPEFRFQVVKYCRTALERQVGEATRIALRGSTLNSKAGYNRSGVARLSLRPEEMIPTRRKEDVDEGVQQGLARMGERAIEKAEAENRLSKKRDRDSDQFRKERKRKLKYTIEEEDWGLAPAEMDNLERNEIAKTRFLVSDLL